MCVAAYKHCTPNGVQIVRTVVAAINISLLRSEANFKVALQT